MTLARYYGDAAVADRNNVPGDHDEIEHGGLEFTGVDLIRIDTRTTSNLFYLLSFLTY
jgi:hypothetical protein